MSGLLYIVATPIGNLGDISERAIATLKQVDLIAAEDTRHSHTLLQRFGIHTKICAYHEHNEEKVTRKLIEQIQADNSIALICDAGTPLINDPGYKLVVAAYNNNIRVVPIPGPSAIVTALSASGLATNKFIYEGYLPAKSEARKTRLNELSNESRTLVFYEAPHRVVTSVKIMQEVFGGERHVTIARELTKQFEQIVRDKLFVINEKFESGEITIKGEFVIVVEGAAEVSISDQEILRIYQILAEKLSLKDAVKLTTKITGKKKNGVYQLVLNELDN